MKLGLFAAALALALSAAQAQAAPARKAAPPAAGWVYRESVDKLRGGVKKTACIRSVNPVRLGFPYTSQALRLCVREDPANGLNIYLNLPAGGQFMCDYDGCLVSVRFDQGEVQQVLAGTASDGSNDTLFVDEEEGVLRELLQARKAVFEVEFFQAGTQQLVFNVSGLKWRPAED